MSTYYDQWMKKQQERADEITKKVRKKRIFYLEISVVCSIVGFAIFGAFIGGVQGAITDGLIGAALAAILVVILVPCRIVPSSGKGYLKLLKNAVEKVLQTEEQKEDFAMQMLGTGDVTIPKEIEVKGKTDQNGWVIVTKDYIHFVATNLLSRIICLKEVEHIESDKIDSHYHVENVRVNQEFFDIDFYYKKEGSTNNECDVRLRFEHREEQEAVLELLKEIMD